MKLATKLFSGLTLLLALGMARSQSATAEVLFAYDSSLGTFPSAQGWGAFEIDSTGPLTAPNVVGTSANFANALMVDVGGVPTLHIRDTLSDATADLPSFYYAWTPEQQTKLINNGLKFTMVFQGLSTTGSGKGNVRFGFNGTEFEFQNTNIPADRTIEVTNFSSTLAPIDGQFHTLEIFGQKVGTEFLFTYRIDGGPESPRNIITNPAPVPLESAVYFGANSSAGTGTDMLVRSVTMETLNVVQPVLATIDRTNGPRGTLKLINNAAPLTIVGYSISSAGGALDPTTWTSIADTYDSNNNQSVDPNDQWIKLSGPALRDNLAEFEPDGDGATLATGQIVNLGNVWIQNPNEDVQMKLLLVDGTEMPINVQFQGNGGNRFEFGDLDFDGDFDFADFNAKFRTTFGTNTAGMSAAERYQAGDFNGDGTVDEFDFLRYNAGYLAANPGAAALSLSAVPEPAAFVLVAIAVASVAAARGGRRRIAGSGLALALVLSATAREASAASLLAHWKFDEGPGATTAVDSTGGGHNAVNVGTTTSGAPGLIGNAWQFTGGSNHLAVNTAPTNDSLLTLGTTFSYSGWVKTTTNSLGTMFAISDNTQQNEEILLRAAGDEGASGFGSADYLGRPNVQPGQAVSVSKINNGQWRFLTVAQDATGWGLYVDGVLEDSGNADNGLPSPAAVGANTAVIGAYHRAAGVVWGLNGLIDDLAVWNGRLTDAEVKNLYLAGLNGVDAATPFNAKLELQVNETSGAISLVNASGVNFDVDLYRIRSAANSLAPAQWTSLDDANFDSGVWSELAATAGKVSEGAFGESTVLASGMPAISLGAAYNKTINAKDLIFEYHIAGTPVDSLYTGIVSYVTGGATGADFDGNGIVDGADFLRWQRHAGLAGSATQSQGDANGDGNVNAADLTIWRQQFGTPGSGEAALGAVPEPSALALAAFAGAMACVATLRPRRLALSRIAHGAVAAALIGSATTASAAVFVDRDYRLGDDPAEGASIGAVLGSGNGFGSTFDSAGSGGAGNLQDLNVSGNPTYVSVSDRPGAGATRGASFDGVDDYLWTPINLGVPSDVWDNTTLFPTGYPHNFEGIRGQGMQLWAKPHGAQQNVRQEIIKNTGEHGIVITADNKWGLISDAEPPINSGVAVGVDQWAHLMMLSGFSDRVNGRSDVGGVLLVNGVAVAARNDAVEFSATQLLTIGGARLTQDDPLTNPFRGVIDDVKVFVWGTSTTSSANYGVLNLATDNQWIASQLAGKNLADVNLDGVISGDGTGPAATDDVTKLIQGWNSQRTVNGVQVGDWISRQQGDLNFDGVVDLADAFMLRQAFKGVGLDLNMSLFAVGVPEPSAATLAVVSLLALVRRRRAA
jgi:hypothetical protein